MRKMMFFLVLAVLSTLLLAQAPQKMSYQAVVRNSSGVLVTNQAVGLKISILQGSASGTVVFSENYSPNPQTNANGLVTIEIGSGSTITGTFTGINWATGPYFLKTETDPTGGSNYTIVGTSQLLSVPYALQAKTAGTADYNNLINLPVLNISDWNTAYSWGNHAGLYRSISWVPSWANVTGKPTFATVATSGSYNDLSNKPAILNSQWTTSGSNIYYNSGKVGIGTNLPNELLTVNGNAEITGNIIPKGKIIAQNNITIESSGNNVIVLAGANKITISPSGGVTIESNNITLAATGNLTLSGNNVHINGTTIEINASATAKFKGSTSTELSSSGVTTIKGSIVMIN